MTATEELRRLLDERGVEWYEPTMKPNTTWFPDARGVNCRVKPWGDTLCVKRYCLTPAQAIAATLERGTCHIEMLGVDYQCSECGEVVGTSDPTSELHVDGNFIELWHYCPYCGREVER